MYKTSPRPRSKYSLCSSYVDCFFLVGFALHQELSNKSDECYVLLFDYLGCLFATFVLSPSVKTRVIAAHVMNFASLWRWLVYVVGCCSFLTCLFAEAIKEMSNPPSSQWTYQSFTLCLLTTTCPF